MRETHHIEGVKEPRRPFSSLIYRLRPKVSALISSIAVPNLCTYGCTLAMKKSMPAPNVVDMRLPASLVPTGKVLSRFNPCNVFLTAATLVVMVFSATR